MSAALLAQDMPLPALRPDLELLPGPVTRDGEATWTVVDPASNRHFRIGWRAFQLLARWDAGTASALLAQVRSETVVDASHDDVEALLRFLWAGGLTLTSPSGSSADYAVQARSRRTNWTQWAVHHYLFFRIPLVRPDRFLRATAPFVAPLFSPLLRALVLAIGIVGLYLAGRQWSSFISTFEYLFSIAGVVSFGLALVFVKVMHELGHAYTATRYGCRVPTMGVAFLVMWPVLYTDATESWRLVSRRERLHIGAAGMITELAIALLATFAWAVLPDGPARSAAFFVATVSWVTSLAVNANPCMRFDGYYMLSDWLGIDNLQERAFAHGRWAMRQLLFGANEAPPELHSPSVARALAIYAWCVWVYRFFLFLGIGLLVYHFFFKMLGIVLFAVEIVWFIGLPIARELARWWTMRSALAQTGHVRVTLLLLMAVIGLLAVPWHGRIDVPAVLEYEAHAAIHAPRAGRIERVDVAPGQRVAMGDVLLRLSSPELDYQVRLSARRTALRELEVKRSAAGGRDAASIGTLRQSLQAEQAAHEGLLRERERLVIKAPIDGVIADTADALHEGRWIGPSLPLALIVAQPDLVARGLVSDEDVALVSPGATARFYPEDGALPTVDLLVREVEQANTAQLDRPYLASEYTGAVPVRRDSNERLVPERAVYRVRFSPASEGIGEIDTPTRTLRGTVNLAAPPRSIAHRIHDRVAAILIRESGF